MIIDLSIVSTCLGASASLLAIVVGIAAILPLLFETVETKLNDGLARHSARLVLSKLIGLLIFSIVIFTTSLLTGVLAGIAGIESVLYRALAITSVLLFVSGALAIAAAAISVVVVYRRSVRFQ